MKNAKETFSVKMTDSYFKTVARQKLPSHAAVAEAVDNAIACAKDGESAVVLIDVSPVPGTNLNRLTVIDWGKGMTKAQVINALQFGNSHTDEGFLCKYGSGLGNFLLVLSQHEFNWTLMSRKNGKGRWNRVDGPYSTSMTISTADALPDYATKILSKAKELHMYGEPSTVISVETNATVLGTMLTSDERFKNKKLNLNLIRRALVEHFGIKYRGFLAPNPVNGKVGAVILLTNFAYDGNHRENIFLRPIYQPYKMVNSKSFTVNYGKYHVPVTLEYGYLDKAKCKKLVLGNYPMMYYYAYTLATQGADIVVRGKTGDRVIATAQIETIWNKSRHPSMNGWSGSITVDVEAAGLPRNLLNTLSNKSDIDENDELWQAIFKEVRKCVTPTAAPDGRLEYIKARQDALQVDDPDATLCLDYKVFANRVSVDMVKIAPDGKTSEIDIFAKKPVPSADDITRCLLAFAGMYEKNVPAKKVRLHYGVHPLMSFDMCEQMNDFGKQFGMKIEMVYDEDFPV